MSLNPTARHNLGAARQALTELRQRFRKDGRAVIEIVTDGADFNVRIAGKAIGGVPLLGDVEVLAKFNVAIDSIARALGRPEGTWQNSGRSATADRVDPHRDAAAITHSTPATPEEFWPQNSTAPGSDPLADPDGAQPEAISVAAETPPTGSASTHGLGDSLVAPAPNRLDGRRTAKPPDAESASAPADQGTTGAPAATGESLQTPRSSARSSNVASHDIHDKPGTRPRGARSLTATPASHEDAGARANPWRPPC